MTAEETWVHSVKIFRLRLIATVIPSLAHDPWELFLLDSACAVGELIFHLRELNGIVFCEMADSVISSRLLWGCLQYRRIILTVRLRNRNTAATELATWLGLSIF
jgi:hypothetical protein